MLRLTRRFFAMSHAPKVPTPHISAQAGDFAETVLMPGGTIGEQIDRFQTLRHHKVKPSDIKVQISLNSRDA